MPALQHYPGPNSGASDVSLAAEGAQCPGTSLDFEHGGSF
jgi:hypothetical protein